MGKINNENELTRSVAILTLSRTVVNTTRRFPYAFLPTIARQLNVPLSNVQNVMSIQAGVGATSPLLGTLSERYGRKRVMMAMLLLIAFAGIIGALLPKFWMFAVVMVVFGISKMIFDPTIHSYAGDRFPYARRGFAMGIIELSWAGSLLISAPIAAILLDLSGVALVFMTISLSSLLMTGVLWRYIPADNPHKSQQINGISIKDSLRIMRNSPQAMGAVTFSFLLSTANEIFFINYGAWMELSFDLVLTALGTVTIVIAVAEIFGEFVVIGMADRYGKRRLALIGSGVSTVMYFIIPHLSFSLPLALAGIFVLFLGVETAIVSSIPLFSEILPNARAVMMSSMMGAASSGRLVGALLGGFLYEHTDNFITMGIISVLIGLLSCAMLWFFVREHISTDLAQPETPAS